MSNIQVNNDSSILYQVIDDGQTIRIYDEKHDRSLIVSEGDKTEFRSLHESYIDVNQVLAILCYSDADWSHSWHYSSPELYGNTEETLEDL